MSLANQIIEHGPWRDSGRIMGTAEMADLNALRDELIAARKLREVLGRYEVDSVYSTGELYATLECTRPGCPWMAELDAIPMTLAELVQRAEEHTEVCR